MKSFPNHLIYLRLNNIYNIYKTGKGGPANRPPSAFSLRYLQFESRALPSTLEPIVSIPLAPSQSVRQRSESVDSIVGLQQQQQQQSSTSNNVTKLPSLFLTPQKITASLDNCKYTNKFFFFFFRVYR